MDAPTLSAASLSFWVTSGGSKDSMEGYRKRASKAFHSAIPALAKIFLAQFWTVILWHAGMPCEQLFTQR